MRQKEYEVTWTARYTTRITLEPGQVLSDAIEDINIPEDAKSSYSCGSFDVEEVRGPDNKRVPDSKHDTIQGDAVVDALYTSVFDDGAVVCTSKCKFDPNSLRVFDIETAENADDANDTNARTDEYVTLPDGTVLRDADSDVTFDY
jgi:hypothetical protein